MSAARYDLSLALLNVIHQKHQTGTLSNDESRSRIRIGRLSPDLLKSAKIKDYEVWTTVSILVKIMFRPNYALSPDVICNLKASMDTAKAVFTSETEPNSVVLLTLEQLNGDPVIVALKLDCQKPEGKGLNHMVTSVYPKQNYAHKFAEWETKKLLICGAI